MVSLISAGSPDPAGGTGYEHVKRLLDRYLELLKLELGERLVSVALYGSVAKGEAKAESDVDPPLVAEACPGTRAPASI